MSKTPGLTEFSQRRSIEALHQALDHTYRLLLETAKADWKRLFAGQDPRDSCVNVHISEEQMADELAAVPHARLVPIRSKRISGKVRRRLA